MAQKRLIGMDPSMSNWGLCAGIYDTETNKLKIESLKVVKPETSKNKKVRQNSKDIERSEYLFQAVYQYIQFVDPHMVFIEIPIGSQSARAMASYGICIGIIGSLKALGIPVIEVTPTEVKVTVTGDKNATKHEMIQTNMVNHPKAPWPMQTVKGEVSVIASKAEHMADAIGAIEAGINTDTFTQVLKLSGI